MSLGQSVIAARPAAAVGPTLWRLRGSLAALALAAGAAVAFVAVPAYAAFDSTYSLVWGQEVVHGRLPSFDAYRAPTEHPLWVALGALLAPLGEAADRALVGLCIAAFVALVIGFFRLARAVTNEPVAWIASLLLLSRLDYGFLAARGFVDMPFLALVVWAAALESERPRRGGPVWALLFAAGLLRPEAWLLAAGYVVWTGAGDRLRRAGWALLAPAIWLATDALVTGDPLYSLNYTTRSARALGRRVPLEDLPERLVHYLSGLTKLPVLLVGLVGIALAWWLVRPRRRLALPLFLMGFGVLTFLAISARGFAVIDRYLVLSALSITLFAAFALGGWSMLSAGHRWRLPWALAALAAVVLGAGWTAARFSPGHIKWELRSRQVVHADLVRLLADPRVRAARRCGPITVPNHKLVPDVRFLLRGDEVVARSALPDAGRARGGAALYAIGGRRFLGHPAYGPFDQLGDSPLVQVPGPAFERVRAGRYLVAYVNCA
jgi:hypothetical protein